MKRISTVLVSVSDKSDLSTIAELAKMYDWTVYASSGSQKELEQLGVGARSMQEVTKNPEAFGGRMKTISFELASSLLFRRGVEEDEQQIREKGIPVIDAVIGNLYPFEKGVEDELSFKELIELIDIGGPTMLRSAAKNYESVCVLSSPQQYKAFKVELKKNNGATSQEFRLQRAKEVFSLMASVEQEIAFQLSKKISHPNEDSQILSSSAEKIPLRYGENPHQKAWLLPSVPSEGGLSRAVILQGKEMSYNNYLDLDAGLGLGVQLRQIQLPGAQSAIIIKHGNPCGVCLSTNGQKEAIQKAWAGDPVSAFGSVVVLTGSCEVQTAQFLKDKFVEVVVAPDFSAQALELLGLKKKTRLVKLEDPYWKLDRVEVRSITGAQLIQTTDFVEAETARSINFVTSQKAIREDDFYTFGQMVCQSLKSNAVVLVGEKRDCFFLAGAGMGQPNRVEALEKLAIPRAKERELWHSGPVLFSDAFFPFPDIIQLCAQHGIKTIIQPGGSIRDDAVIDECNKHSIAMGFSGRRHFLH